MGHPTDCATQASQVKTFKNNHIFYILLQQSLMPRSELVWGGGKGGNLTIGRGGGGEGERRGGRGEREREEHKTTNTLDTLIKNNNG